MDKAELRSRMRSLPGIDPGRAFLVVSGLFAWLSARLPGTASAFLAMEHEIDVSPLFDRLPGWRWVLPRVEDDRSLTFRDRAVPREQHRFGMLQPVGEGPVIPVQEIDVLLVPGLAFDRDGGRLGHGSGYYDRILSARRADSDAVGVAVSEMVLDRVPMLGHDQRIDWLATEDGVRECSPRS